MSGTGKGKGKGKSAPPSGGAGAEGGKGKKSKSVSRSSRAGLQFPVGRIHRHLKSKVRFRNFSGCGKKSLAILPQMLLARRMTQLIEPDVCSHA